MSVLENNYILRLAIPKIEPKGSTVIIAAPEKAGVRTKLDGDDESEESVTPWYDTLS